MVIVAAAMSLLAFGCSRWVNIPVHDPDGFLGPAYLRFPLLCAAAFLADMIPRTVWRSHGLPARFRHEAAVLVKEHWTRERVVLVVVGLLSFYFTYVSYRNLKNFLPFVRTTDHGTQALTYDDQLHALDRWLLFGHDPAAVLHGLLGTGISAHVLADDYLLFLPLIPVTVTASLVWSSNISFGYWYVTSQGLCWTLGTASYYLVPSLGPAFAFPWLYTSVPVTGVTSLQEALFNGRLDAHVNPYVSGVQSVAAFASLHVAITLMMALVGQYTIRHKPIRIALWVYCAVTTVSTSYFGWHYLADDAAGALIAVVSFYVGARATGQTFDLALRDAPRAQGSEGRLGEATFGHGVRWTWRNRNVRTPDPALDTEWQVSR